MTKKLKDIIQTNIAIISEKKLDKIIESTKDEESKNLICEEIGSYTDDRGYYRMRNSTVAIIVPNDKNITNQPDSIFFDEDTPEFQKVMKEALKEDIDKFIYIVKLNK